ncbi:hypothetical protein M2145_002113 [Lachnospiraceae bacterium PF1-21]|uniref:Uncharacterized protein n=1 Tax=Ohessyouella blattaphilus TaxID=2949333 RepID=A0ABT1EL50_9FIRM|nr:hypothetical protein [Ohessyouella blattaphilus]MCP1111429.1 hypothetical protein [Ohessyouella blattaphilus]MCR8564823.1 hypothetical protein [Ohessyouella blattaphilus]MDL2249824.1 hypothetical protein [Lachnospiraceae bacterium OttesenSCG-928-J05]
MIKVRLQGTREEILWFREQILARNGNIEVNEISDFFNNKGTKKFVRNYMEISKAKKRK